MIDTLIFGIQLISIGVVSYWAFKQDQEEDPQDKN